MANDEHIALLKQGEPAWNAWRRDNPNIRPDFSGADLRGVNLTPAADVGFSGADLRGANFSGADLRGALLTGATGGRILEERTLAGRKPAWQISAAQTFGKLSSSGRRSRLPISLEQILRTQISPVVTSTAYPRGV